VIDETGDRKDGTKTAHVGRQYLGSRGKIGNGIVAVSSLWIVFHPENRADLVVRRAQRLQAVGLWLGQGVEGRISAELMPSRWVPDHDTRGEPSA
jgi:hypothetical protein